MKIIIILLLLLIINCQLSCLGSCTRTVGSVTSCMFITQNDCNVFNGTFSQNDFSCSTTSPCCLQNGLFASCSYQNPDSCTGIVLPCNTCSNIGACCLNSLFGPSCSNIDQTTCISQIPPGIFNGIGSSCSLCSNCQTIIPTGACCFSNTTCEITTNTTCINNNGIFQGVNTTCIILYNK